eukprot:CAMPEP_0206153738 /NCGR_PEP_ID=MMETSP1474-20131121/849_1 /ASSEMBLY_ACC=CAM_ASM_001110 /TAXON_ID=97495 /ORGANISM="Imantonia sp., Strain RCC918" /LENGTH=423 /DNA_ID=CAMNT_0053551671 /DNA_START=24 /DNA_END=1295 /DNA_ORIENTATION=-
MKQHVIVLFCLIAACFAQLGGFSGPCSASPIHDLGVVPVSIFSTNVNAETSTSYYCTSISTYSGTTWFSVQADAGTRLNATTCNSYTEFDTVITLYNGTCYNPQCVLYNDDTSCYSANVGGTSKIEWTSDGNEYLIGVSGFSSNEGQFELILTARTPENTPSCTEAIALPGPYFPPLVLEGSNVNAPTYSQDTCGIETYYPVSWYTITPEADLEVTVSTCGYYTDFDTKIAVLDGTCGFLDCVVHNDDNCTDYSSLTSTVSFAPSGGAYYVAVLGYAGQTGNYQLTISQARQSCSTGEPTVLSRSTYDSVIINTVTEPALTHSTCASETGPAYWLTFTADVSGYFYANTCSSLTNFDTYMSVYEGSCLGYTCVTYNDDSSCSYSSYDSSVAFDVSSGETFSIVITGYAGNTGTAEVTYTFDAY